MTAFNNQPLMSNGKCIKIKVYMLYNSKNNLKYINANYKLLSI